MKVQGQLRYSFSRVLVHDGGPRNTRVKDGKRSRVIPLNTTVVVVVVVVVTCSNCNDWLTIL